MGKIALVQSPSYMSYSSKSDIRPHLQTLGHHTENILLYTSHNISKLKFDLHEKNIDGIIFSSNSLNEKKIFDEVQSREFKIAFHKFLDQGKGCLIMHQMKLAEQALMDEGGELNFLHPDINTVKLVKRVNESPVSGAIHKAMLSVGHPLLNYPNSISIEGLKDHCISKKGLYWQYLTDLDPLGWDVLLYDETEDYGKRTLLACTRETYKHRIVISSMNLDWQKEETLMSNILSYVLEGKSHTAILVDVHYDNIGFDFFIASLKSKHYRFKIYDIQNDLSELKDQVRKGIHNIVVLGPYSDDLQDSITELNNFIYDYTMKGKVKYIGVESNPYKLKQLFIAGREKSMIKTLQDVELKVQRDLNREGLLDGSFWSSVEVLKTLDDMEWTFSTFSFDSVEKVFEHAESHLGVGDGSYDGLISPTVALLWIRCKYLGIDAEETRKTIRWLKDNIEEEELREQLLTYNTFFDLGIEIESTTDKLRQIIFESNIIHLNEMELIYFLRSALHLRETAHIVRFISNLHEIHDSNKLWIDISISATIVNLLIDSLVLLQEEDVYTSELEKQIEDLVFSTILSIQSTLNKGDLLEEISYPWENKASTSLQSIRAMLKFDQLVDLPIAEIEQSLLSYTSTIQNHSVDRSALEVVEDFRIVNSNLISDNKNLENERKQYQTNLAKLQSDYNSVETEKNIYNQKIKNLQDELSDKSKELKKKDRATLINKIALTSWVLVAIIIGWVSLYYSSNFEDFQKIYTFYKGYKDIINGSLLLVPATWAVMVGPILMKNFDSNRNRAS